MKKVTFLLLFILTASCPLYSQRNTVQPVMEYIETHNIHFVDFIFLDLLGTLRKITLPKEYVPAAVKNGLSFDGSSIPGYSTVFNSDMVLKPDFSTIVEVPWTDGETKVASIICDIYVDEKTPYIGDPRYILKTLSREVRNLGYEFLVGIELEYFVFKDVNGKLETIEQEAYCQASYNLKYEEYNNKLLNYLSRFGVHMEKRHHEVAPGQYEMSIKYAPALCVADQVMRAQYAIKAVSEASGFAVTFMPKPYFGENGNGMHINFSLYDSSKKKNAFYSYEDPQHFSPLMKQFIAGVLKHADELSALFNSTINSYRRLIPGYEAPRSICWGTKNRTALIRIPLTRGQKSATRGEMRSPDPLCNPYLAFAALLKMGLAGVSHNYELPNAVEEKIPDTIKALPITLDEALEKLEKSSLARDLLGDTLFSKWTTLKRKECEDFIKAGNKADSAEVTDWEWKRYF